MVTLAIEYVDRETGKWYFSFFCLVVKLRGIFRDGIEERGWEKDKLGTTGRL